MTRTKLLSGCAVLVLTLALSGASAWSTTSYDFLFSADQVADDSQFFLNLTVRNYRYSRPAIEPVLPRLRYVEMDLPVVLFLAQKSRRPVDHIVTLRAQGLPWSAVFQSVRVPYDVLFVGIDRDPGPPYGKAWGHWKKRRKSQWLTDSDVHGLVLVQIGSHIARVPQFEVARARAQGVAVVTYVAEKHGRPYRGRTFASHGQGKKQGHEGHGKRKGRK